MDKYNAVKILAVSNMSCACDDPELSCDNDCEQKKEAENLEALFEEGYCTLVARAEGFLEAFKYYQQHSTELYDVQYFKDRYKKWYKEKGVEYAAWKAMKRRCYNKNSRQYKYYGGRGIIVCASWLHDPDEFIKNIGPKPSSSHSLDRINNDGPYSPDNCRWATKTQQSKNRRRFRKC